VKRSHRYRGFTVRRSALSVITSLALLGSPTLSAGAGTTGSSGLLGSPALWATVDVCQSAPAGDVVGLRGSMPGTGANNEQMYMHFRLQYRGTRGNWHYVPGADSGLVEAGSAQFASRQVGLDFHLTTPAVAGGLVVRGVVWFEWRIKMRVVHATILHTTRGHDASAGASPPGFSAAHCALS
jgi:hypothetical protein